MLDLKLVRDDPEGVKAALAKRGPGAAGLVDRLLEADATRRRLVTEVDALRATQKRRGREVARAAPDQRQQVLTGLKELSDRLAEAEASLRAAEAELAELQGRMPNLPDPATPAGGEEDSVELRRVGTPGVFDFEVRDHLELGELLGAIDTVRAAKVSGARFGYLLGPGALLEFALVRFAMDRLTAAGFVPMIPPVLVRREAMFGTGFLPTDEQQIFRTADDDLYLTGTSEVPLVAYHSDELLDPGALPLRYAGFSTCFRREAGTYGKDTRGIFRVHQFDKAEMFSFVHPDRSWDELEAILALQESIVGGLGLPYRVVSCATDELGAAAAKKYDIEVWLPSEGRYRELTSCSNYLDYSARRLSTRFRDDGGTSPVHTLNGTACAVGRTLVFLFEHYQRPDGSFAVPEVLIPLCGFDRVEVRRS